MDTGWETGVRRLIQAGQFEAFQCLWAVGSYRRLWSESGRPGGRWMSFACNSRSLPGRREPRGVWCGGHVPTVGQLRQRPCSAQQAARPAPGGPDPDQSTAARDPAGLRGGETAAVGGVWLFPPVAEATVPGPQSPLGPAMSRKPLTAHITAWPTTSCSLLLAGTENLLSTLFP